MAKRFTESKIWDDVWFQELPTEWKLLWKYICDKCDEAGVWKINHSLAEFQLKTTIKWNESDKYFNNGKVRIEFYNGFWLIKEFVIFQYGEKVFTSINPFHKKIREMLDRVSKRVLNTHKVKDKDKDKVKDKEEVKEVRGVIGEIIDDLNLILGTSYKSTSKQTQDLIKTRLNDGFTLEDFKVVHRKMLRSWGADEKMVKYLRPITLYGNKFEGYLNQKSVTTKLTPEGVKAYLIGQEWLKQSEVIDA